MSEYTSSIFIKKKGSRKQFEKDIIERIKDTGTEQKHDTDKEKRG